VVQILDYGDGPERATMRCMADYGRFCPVALASEVLADRWTPLIIRELVVGNTRFNSIARGLPGISRSLLVQRLRHLERCGVVELAPSPSGRGNEYRLTDAGKDLEGVVVALGRWAIEWMFDDLRPQDVDAFTVTWWMHRRIDLERVPSPRVVIEFRYTAPNRQVFWMVVDRGEPSVCIHHPGFEPDVVLTASTRALVDVFYGFDTWANAVDRGAIDVAGPPRLARAVPRWFLWSPFREETRRRAERASAQR
jgi:DNA-binding HxlR family transcriptional regulator